MNLKESYRYANYLDNLLNIAYRYLQNKGFVTSTEQKHLRSKANSEATDETIEVQKPYDVEFTPNNVIDFAVNVIKEKEALVNAIAMAKVTTEINIDNSVSMNKKKQEFVSVLNSIVGIKPSEKTLSGRDYAFDINKEQKPYTYTINECTVIDFDRDNVKGLIKKFSKETDNISTKLDAIEINTVVDFNCKYDINDSFEDLVVAK